MLYKPQGSRVSAAFPHIRSIRFILIGLMFLSVAFAGMRTQRIASAQNDPTQPQVGPGVQNVGSNASRTAAGSLKAGSVLFFHKFTSDVSRPSLVNTLLTITNTNPRDAVNLRIFFVSDCGVSDQFVTLAGNQSRALLASKEAADKTGYAIAVAVDSRGYPTQFNWLIGNANIRDAAGHEAGYNAFAVAKRSAGSAALNDAGTAAEMIFDNGEYDRLPKVLAIDHLKNQNTVNGPTYKTDIAIFSPLADLSGASPNAFKLTATAYDYLGMEFSQEVDVDCGLNSAVGDIWLTTPFNAIVAANRPGWATFAGRSGETADLPLLGLSLTDGVIEQMHNARVMQALEWLDTYRISVPVKPPTSPVADVITQALHDSASGALGASESKAGSILLYPRFTSGEHGSTQIFVTNAHPSERARLRVFYSGLADPVDVKESFVMISARQTAELNPDAIAPNQRGWAIIVAVDGRGLPAQFNYLIGSAQVAEPGGQKASFNAVAIAKNNAETPARNEDGKTLDLVFNDENYDRLPATTAMSFVPSQADNATLLGFSRVSASLLEPPNTRGAISVSLIDARIASFGANAPRTETLLSLLKPSPNLPPITNTILQGEHGWLKLVSTAPVTTWSLNKADVSFVAGDAGTWSGGFNGDGNLHILTLAENFLMKFPATSQNNTPPSALAETIGLQVEARRASGTIVRLDGAASSDEDPDDVLAYEWLDNEQLVSRARISDRRLGLGSHNIKLIVSDLEGAVSLPDEQSVEIVDTMPPQISGLPSNVSKTTDNLLGEAVNFAIPAAYDMVDGNVFVTSSREPGSVFPIGKTTVTFTAVDRAGNAATASMEVSVIFGTPQPQVGGAAGSMAPQMDNLNDQYVRAGEIRNITLRGTDPDGDPLTFAVVGAPNYAAIVNGDPAQRTAILRIAPQTGDSSGKSGVRIVVSDNRGQSFTTLPFLIMISDAANDETGSGDSVNRAPLGVIAELPQVIQAASRNGANITLDASRSTDPDGDQLKFTWFDGETIIAQGAVADISLPAGRHSIKLTVFDGKDGLTMIGPFPVEVLPRDLTGISASPGRLNRNTQYTLTVLGTGFSPAAELRFSKFGVSVTKYQLVDEDKIVATIDVAPNATPAFRDIYVVNPNGRSVRMRSALYIHP